MRDTQVEELAHKIRRMWAEERRRFDLRTSGVPSDWGNRHMNKWDGGKAKDGKHYNPVWPKIAQLCIDEHLDPLLLVRAIFYHRDQYPPEPNQAAGNTALDRYRMYTSPSTQLEIQNSLLNALGCDRALSTAEVARQKHYYNRDDACAWRLTLVSTTVNLSPLFRYCVAKNQQWDDLAEQFYSAAVKQYAQHPEIYNDVWSEWIPATLKEVIKARGEVKA